jgi:hypothetical protein
MTVILNKTKRASERFRLLRGSMGSYKLPEGHPNHRWQIAHGADRGNGYQGYMALSYFLTAPLPWVPDEARQAARKALTPEELAFIDAAPHEEKA